VSGLDSVGAAYALKAQCSQESLDADQRFFKDKMMADNMMKIILSSIILSF
jgi:hypothetical protein